MAVVLVRSPRAISVVFLALFSLSAQRERERERERESTERRRVLL